ncbi:hypothetical protein FA95DRAFT_1610754 [Auriscalpium vulgare]|uniref:Uncharacterized protein n=1 Tax=Auriscalpium vulgare TaxID=40419 RepID=A0ACB8RC62_9AGAM|nr:hypothetical protein FA95DRAFT_1610754 [Auriscalpium vulgare]
MSSQTIHPSICRAHKFLILALSSAVLLEAIRKRCRDALINIPDESLEDPSLRTPDAPGMVWFTTFLLVAA